jgi:hypothetical protein
MGANQVRSKGFTLIAALLLLLLMSGVALGLMYMVNTESRVGGGDLENGLAFHAAEGGMEKMTADLANLFSSQQAPTPANIANLQNFPPAISGVTYPNYLINVPMNPDGTYESKVSTISAGPNAGLIAQIIPMTLSVTAQRPLGDQVRMVRTVEVALIPVFQFGVFSDMDLSYHPGPAFDFAGRVHTNGNLFISAGTSLQLHSKVSAVKEVVRATLPNGWPTSSGYTGPVYVPQAPTGCDISNPPGANCRALGLNEGSKVGDQNSANNPNWTSISVGTYNSWIINGRTGATPLTLPFVGAGVGPIQIIRRPAPGELPGSTLSASRLYNQAQIRVMISDTAAENHPDATPVDAQDIQLTSVAAGDKIYPAGTGWSNGITVNGVAGLNYFGQARAATDDAVIPFQYTALNPPEWPQIDGWVRVEVRKADSTWMAVTQEWLQQGFARNVLPPDSSAARPNNVHPNAILIFQELADRNASGTITAADAPSNITGANSQYSWYPINFYDAREGEPREQDFGNGTCTPNGLMNAVEIDVGNLKRWLAGTIPGNGTQVDWAAQNGYVLFFSDRRGMVADPFTIPAVKVGEYGFEDVVNAGSSAGVPDGALEALNPGTTQSPEDVDQNAKLDKWGAVNVGDGFNLNNKVNAIAAAPNPFVPGNRIASCVRTGRKNRVTGARHVVRLVNGSRGNVPTRPDGKGGFTVASENPVYIVGDYNAKAADNAWVDDQHAAAAVIADAITLQSNSWTDLNSTINTTIATNRNASQTWYRLAIAAGKNVYFPKPTWGGSDDGSDGGLHNFLRYIEDWSPTKLHYQGSLVSLYYSQYNTGIFKCCSVVYSPPQRDYSFDTLFLNPANLPPGTPMFRDVDNVSYRQDFTPY